MVEIRPNPDAEGRHARSTADHPTRVLLVDDHPLLREGVVAVLSRDADLVVTGAVGTIEEARAAIARGGIDLVVLDQQLPDGEGITVCPEFLARHPSLRIIVFTLFRSADLARDALAAGARGFVVKSADPEHLRAAIRTVLAGGTYTDPSVRGDYGLTSNELEVLALVAEGLTNGQIAERVGLSHHTVKTHLGYAMAKLGVTGRTEAAARSVALGLASPKSARRGSKRPKE